MGVDTRLPLISGASDSCEPVQPGDAEASAGVPAPFLKNRIAVAATPPASAVAVRNSKISAGPTHRLRAARSLASPAPSNRVVNRTKPAASTTAPTVRLATRPEIGRAHV